MDDDDDEDILAYFVYVSGAYRRAFHKLTACLRRFLFKETLRERFTQSGQRST